MYFWGSIYKHKTIKDNGLKQIAVASGTELWLKVETTLDERRKIPYNIIADYVGVHKNTLSRYLKGVKDEDDLS